MGADTNVFNGIAVHGIPDSVIISGRIVMDEGQLRVMQGYGKFIALPPYGAHVYEKVRAKEAEMRQQQLLYGHHPSHCPQTEIPPRPCHRLPQSSPTRRKKQLVNRNRVLI